MKGWKESIKISKNTMQILVPLSEHRSQLLGRGFLNPDGVTFSTGTIGNGYASDPKTPTISHADFVAEVVLPALEGACMRFGQESVARDIVELVLLLYPGDSKTLYKADAASFLSCTLRGGYGKDGNISRNVTNPILAEKYGIKYVFGPIVDLGLTHQETKVFDTTKFFHCHACRMGEVIDNFSQKDYLGYIELCKKLLKDGIYDWSMENDPEEWGMLRPSINLYGLEAVLLPVVQAMIAVGRLPGTKDYKYKFSFLHVVIQALYPILLPRVRKEGVAEIGKMLSPIVGTILELAKDGAFKDTQGGIWESVEGEFFLELKRLCLAEVPKKGIQQVLVEMKPKWKKKLTKKARS